MIPETYYEDDREMSNRRTVFALARLADCTDPDSDDSPGAHWLELVEHNAVEGYAERNEIYPQDSIHEIADSVVPIYTANLWAVFADLAAWNEDLEGCLDGSDLDMNKAASTALYLIAERLIAAIWKELSETTEEATE